MDTARFKAAFCAAMCVTAMQACAAQPESRPSTVAQPDRNQPDTISQNQPGEQVEPTQPTTIGQPGAQPGGDDQSGGGQGVAPSGTAESGTATAAPGTVIEATGTATAESGVVYPEKPGKVRPIKDALPPAERTKAETDRLAEMQFAVDPRQQIEKYVKGLKLPKDFPILQRAHVFFLDNPTLKKIFPASVLYVLRFPQWPVAMAPVPPLGNNNIFVISKEAKDASAVKDARDSKDLVLLTDVNEDSLKQFLMKTVTATSEAGAETAVEASLALTQELVQDGMFKFAIDQSSVKATKSGAGLKATGQVNVAPAGGNSGSITVNLLFTEKGALAEFKKEVNLVAGMRPICQSTKLLDPDPIVRRMAEQDLLIMGSSAKEYLDWQRTQVSAELRAAIDKIWARIVKEGR